MYWAYLSDEAGRYPDLITHMNKIAIVITPLLNIEIEMRKEEEGHDERGEEPLQCWLQEPHRPEAQTDARRPRKTPAGKRLGLGVGGRRRL